MLVTSHNMHRVVFFKISVVVGIAFWLAHVISLPVLVTYDSAGYIDLSSVLFSNRFPGDWTALRAPLFPFALKVSFYAFGFQPLAAILVPASLALVGSVVLASAIRRTVGPVAAGLCFLLLSFYPTFITYQHSVLTETGSFLFIAAACALTVPASPESPRWVWLQAAAIVTTIIVGFYWRQPILYIAVPVALLHAVSIQPSASRDALTLLLRDIRVAAIIVIPMLASLPLDRIASSTVLRDLTLKEGLIRQALIPPEDPFVAPCRERYLSAIRNATRNGNFYSGIKWIDLEKLFREMYVTPLPQKGGRLFAAVAARHPVRYFSAFCRSVLFFAGMPGVESDNRDFRDLVLSKTLGGSKINQGPPGIRLAIRERFAQTTTTDSGVLKMLRALVIPYDALIPVGSLMTLLGLVASCVIRSRALASFCLIPICFLAIHAASLVTIDRLMMPIYPILLTNVLVIPILVYKELEERPRHELGQLALLCGVCFGNVWRMACGRLTQARKRR